MEHTEHLPDIICAECATDSIYSNGNTDCCAECGGQDYLSLTDPKIHSDIKPLVDLFESWKPIFGGKQ